MSFLFPETCLGCKRPGNALCSLCSTTLTPAPPISALDYALFSYNHPLMRTIIWNIKYYRYASATRALIDRNHTIIQQFITAYTETDMIVFVPIPQHVSKTWSRGYNQSELIAHWLAKNIPHSHVQTILQKKRGTTPQAQSKNKKDRLQNVRDTLSAKRSYKKSLSPDAVYVLVDDVITTGATMNEARRALQQIGAKKVLSVSLAHG